jgi:adenosine/AMP kinase
VPVGRAKSDGLDLVQVQLDSTTSEGDIFDADGASPKGVEGPADIAWRKKFLRQIGYKG